MAELDNPNAKEKLKLVRKWFPNYCNDAWGEG
jgi:hypothetical protein